MRVSSPAGSGDLIHVGPQSVVAPAETELRRSSFQLDCRVDLAHFTPWDRHFPAAPDPAREPADQPRALPPVAGAAEDRDHLGHLADTSFDREVVDVAAPPSVLVEQLMVCLL